MAINKTNAIPTWNEVKQLHPNIVEVNTGYNIDSYNTLLEMLNSTARAFVDTGYINKDNCIAIYKFSSNNPQKQYHIFGYTRVGVDIVTVLYMSGYYYTEIGNVYVYKDSVWTKQ